MSEPMTPARIRAPQWRAAVAALEKALSGREPVDVALQNWFREHREMGGRDRATVTGLVYGVLRDATRLQQIAGTPASAATWLGLHALTIARLDADGLRALAGADAETAIRRHAQCGAAELTDAAQHNVPEPIWQQWRLQYGDQAAAIAQALNAEAPVDLRVNTLKATREQAVAALAEAGVLATPTALSPLGLRLAKRAALHSMPAYRDGWIEPQDEGSQLLALMVGAAPGERVADFCAGAGGKTLALGAAIRNDGELWALDISAARLARIGPRAARAGLDIVHARSLPDAEWLRAQRRRFDAVLVDAPCSATGTWRRNPELRLRAIDFDALARVQREVLAAAAELVRPGGRLVYATCSLMASENDAVIDDFLAANPGFQVQRPEGIADPVLDGDRLRLRPDRHGTDGFFAVRMLRRDDAAN
jgi:16S rRNA (cytosine967-C5)-methyltransferase